MRPFHPDAEKRDRASKRVQGQRTAARELAVAQSRWRQPFRNTPEPAISNTKNGNHMYVATLTLLLADIAFLLIAALTGVLVDVYFFAGSPLAEVQGALGLLLSFVTMSVLFLKLIEAQQTPLRVFSLRESAQAAGIVSFASMFVWGLAELASPSHLNGQVAAVVWASALLLLPIGRAGVRQALHSRGIGYKRVVVVGDINQAMPVITQLSKSGSFYRVAGMVAAANDKDVPTVSVQRLNALPEVIANARASEVLIAVSNSQYAAVREAVRNSVPEGVTVYVALSPLLEETDAGEPEMVEGIPAVRFRDRALPWQYETIKGAFDFTVAFTLFLIFSPLMALAAIAVKLDSPGPVFFKQVRVGRRGEHFNMYKFRSMKMNAETMLQELMQHNEASGAIFKMKNDPRITRVGKIIRKFSIDELPQLFNVLNGTMSLVGPRPPLPKELQHYEEWHFTRLDGMPGITGLWQVNRGPAPNFEEMVAYDLEYLRHWSLQKDLLIMLKTVPMVIAGRGAY